MWAGSAENWTKPHVYKPGLPKALKITGSFSRCCWSQCSDFQKNSHKCKADKNGSVRRWIFAVPEVSLKPALFMGLERWWLVVTRSVLVTLELWWGHRERSDGHRYRCCLGWCRLPREVCSAGHWWEFSTFSGNGRNSWGRGCTVRSQVMETPLFLVV